MPVQSSVLISPDSPFEIKSEGYVRIDQFSLLEDFESQKGSRFVIFADVTTQTHDKREVKMNVAISSFVIGRDFSQSCNLMISPSDKCILSIQGAKVPVQMMITSYN